MVVQGPSWVADLDIQQVLDHTACRQQCVEQFQKYVNRYGPGLVIYWFGYVQELQGCDDSIMLADSFPAAADLTLLPRLQV